MLHMETAQAPATSPEKSDVTIYVRQEHVMKTADDIVQSHYNAKRIVLRARGNSIPNAVAVANILSQNMPENHLDTASVKVDSEAPPGMGRMISNIEIVLQRRLEPPAS